MLQPYLQDSLHKTSPYIFLLASAPLSPVTEMLFANESAHNQQSSQCKMQDMGQQLIQAAVLKEKITN